MEAIGGVGLLIILGGYFLPVLIALMRGRQNAGAILVLNLFLGWTLVGWVVALVWAVSHDDAIDRRSAERIAAQSAAFHAKQNQPDPQAQFKLRSGSLPSRDDPAARRAAVRQMHGIEDQAPPDRPKPTLRDMGIGQSEEEKLAALRRMYGLDEDDAPSDVVEKPEPPAPAR